MKNCKQCGYQFSSVSTRYYCCDKSEPVCITCRRDICKKCKRPRTSEVLAPKCDKCLSRLYQNDLLCEYNCDRYYCAKCLSELFKNAYAEVAIQQLYDQKNQQIFAKMYCGHQYPYNDLLAYFQHFCLECGRSYDSALDYELNDGAKLCYFCIKYLEPKYRSVFIKCVGCDSILQNSSKAQIVDELGMVLCRFCVHQSQIEQKSIQQNRKLPQSKQKPRIVQKRQEIQKIKFSQINKSESLNNKANLLSSPQAIKRQQSKREQKVQGQLKKSTSPLNKFLKKPSISELKQKQSQRADSQNNNESNHTFSVTSKFSNEMEDIDDDLKKELGLTHNIKMKKHLSNQTFVEHFKIQIPQHKITDFVKCKTCNSLISSKIIYDTNQSHLKEESEPLVSFSTIESEIKQNSESNICRVCYLNSSVREKSLIQSKKSLVQSRAKSSRSRHSKLEPSQSSMNYLKVNNFPKRGPHHSPSPSPNKQYSLTGSKHSSIQKPSNISINVNPSKLLFEQKSPQKPQQSKIHHHPKVQQSFKPSPVNQQKKCGMCNLQKKTLIITMKQGHVCQDCYYRKSPHSYVKS